LKTRTRDIASLRIKKLFKLAEDMMGEESELSESYVKTAKRISMAARIHTPKEYKFWICNGCKRLMRPGKSCRIRIQKRREPHIVITCNYCGKLMRYPLKHKKRKKHETTNF
jgi:ribonuclease P protein subunit RPR2